MNNKKRAVLTVMVLAIIMIFIVSVSAGFWDLFKFGEEKEGLEGELEEAKATARVNVTGTALPPIIWFVSKLNGTGGGAAPIPAAGSAYFEFSFLACSIGGTGSLPDPSDIDKVSATFNGTFNGAKQTINAVSCIYRGDLPSPSPCGATVGSKNYSCIGRFYYFYDPIIWGINATIQDRSLKSTSNSSQTFTMDNLYYWAMAPNYVNWTAIESGGDPKQSDNNLTIINQGNYDINDAGGFPLQVNGTNLMKGGGVENITADKFNVTSWNYNSCAQGNKLIELQYVTVTNFLVNHSLSSITQPWNRTINFCLAKVSVSSGIYETGIADPQKWTIKAFN